MLGRSSSCLHILCGVQTGLGGGGVGVRLGKSRVSGTEVPGCLGQQWWPIPGTGRAQVGGVWR